MTRHDDDRADDLERTLLRVMAEQRLTRRVLLERMGKLGAGVALAPIAAACASTGTSAQPSAAAPSAAPPSTAPSAPPASAAAAPSAEPTPQPSPEGELNVYNWADYMGEDVIPSFEDKYGVKVTQEFFDNYDTMYAKIGQNGGGYDVTFPTSVDIPAMLQRGLVQPLDLGLIPNVVNLAPEWADPGYDPGNAHSVPYMWWTTGVAYDSDKIKEAPTSWSALWDPTYDKHIAMLDDSREAFAAALFLLGKDPNTTNDADLDAALAKLQEQKPLLRTYTTDDIGVLSSGDAWIAHAWGSDVYQVQSERPSVKFYIPAEGGVRGSDTAVLLAGAKHPIAAQLFLNHLLDAQVAASNTNYIGYMGPNAAAKAYISPDILADPTVNPDAAVIDKLAELLDLGADLEKYSSRWETLKAGA
jgi:spermidine/putrescine transport system substrate-binding protein